MKLARLVTSAVVLAASVAAVVAGDALVTGASSRPVMATAMPPYQPVRSTATRT